MNFGYCLLGRVIEQLTGLTYERYVQQQILAPLSIRSMRIGATRLEGRAPAEVHYYHPTQPSPCGGWHLEAMDAHGGWLASAVDLARFAASLDDPEHRDILSADSIVCLDERPCGAAGYDAQGKPKDVYDALGWQTRILEDGNRNRWHSGSLPGTATILIRRHDGRNFVALLNTRVSPQAKHLGRELDRLLHQAANAVEQWPTTDHFEAYLSVQP